MYNWLYMHTCRQIRQVISWFYRYVPFRDCVFWCEIALMCVFLVSFYLDILENSED